MSFKVDVPKAVDDQIAAWNLPISIALEVYRRLFQDLADDPVAHLRSVLAPVNVYLYSFTITEPGTPIRKHMFMFQVKFQADEESLAVTNAGYTLQVTHVQPPRPDRNGGHTPPAS